VNSRPMPNPNLRVSDAERQEVADILKQHATDGRLDSAEFEARLDRTLRAKTRGDLAGLLDDLPDLNAPRPGVYPPGPYGYGYPPPRRSPGPYRPHPGGGGFLPTVITVGLVVVAFIATMAALAHATVHFAWVVLLIVAVLIWRRSRGYHRWRA
jgi:DUF1707 SHOCT-like domain